MTIRYVVIKVYPQGRWELVQSSGHWRYATEASALKQAKDLARSNRMYEFIVAATLETVKATEVPVAVEKHETGSDAVEEDEDEEDE